MLTHSEVNASFAACKNAINAQTCTGIQHESKTVFTCGKTSSQQLRQCGNDVNSYSGRVTIPIQCIFLYIQSFVWEDEVRVCLCIRTICVRVCGCLML